MEEFNIKSMDNTFRIKQMNAIELLALQSQISFDGMDKTQSFFNILLEKIEVKLQGKWFPVKEPGRDTYYPSGIENNVEAIQELLNVILNDYLKPVFFGSNASKKEQE